MVKTSTGIDINLDLIVISVVIMICAAFLSLFGAMGGMYACDTWNELDTSEGHIFAPIFCAFTEVFYKLSMWGIFLSSLYIFSRGVLTDSMIAKLKHDWREYTKRKAKKYEEEDKLKDL